MLSIIFNCHYNRFLFPQDLIATHLRVIILPESSSCHSHHLVTVIILSQSLSCHSHYLVTVIILSQSSSCHSHYLVTVIILSQSLSCHSHYLVTVIILSQSLSCHSHHGKMNNQVFFRDHQISVCTTLCYHWFCFKEAFHFLARFQKEIHSLNDKLGSIVSGDSFIPTIHLPRFFISIYYLNHPFCFFLFLIPFVFLFI